MFGKKSSPPSQPSQPWAFRALTTNYLIDGTVQPNGEVKTLILGGPQYYERRYVVSFENARILPTASQALPEFTVPRWSLEHRWGLVALIPDNEASTEAVLESTKGRSLSYRAVMYAGPYIIRATIQPPTEFHAFETYAFMPGKDAEIECLAPGTRLGKINSPWILVNREAWEGFSPA